QGGKLVSKCGAALPLATPPTGAGRRWMCAKIVRRPLLPPDQSGRPRLLAHKHAGRLGPFLPVPGVRLPPDTLRYPCTRDQAPRARTGPARRVLPAVFLLPAENGKR